MEESCKQPSTTVYNNKENVIKFKTILPILLFFSPLLANGSGFSGDVAVIPVVSTGRYSAVLPEPTDSQKNPLKTQIKIRFPKQITRVGDAINYLLKRSGYRLTPYQRADPVQRILLQLPLPEIHRDLGPMPLYRALATLAGEPYLLVFDPVHRLIAFDLKGSFEAIAKH